MTENIHHQSLNAAVSEATELLKQREKLEEQIDKLDKRIGELLWAIRGIAPLCGIDDEAKAYPYLFADEIEPEIGFTDAVRKVMHTPPLEFLSPIQVRDRLIETGFNLDKYTNPMASIHTILKRLVRSGQVDETDEEGRMYYMGNLSYVRKLEEAKKRRKKK
jgi:hypothetical protein